MIQIEHLTKKFGEHVAVDDISFTVNDGEIVGFLGPNGAGKSTTMNILTGYLSSTSGRAMVDGLDILENPMEVKQKIGFLPEMPPLYGEMTVKEYLGFIYDLKRCTLNKKKHIEEICEVTQTTEVMNRMIKNLSKGYRQRVGIAGALIGNPKVIIFDEPTNGLDPKQITEIRSLIKSLGQDHTVILSTHIIGEVKAVCDRIIIINNGRIAADEKINSLENALKSNRKIMATISGPAKEATAAISAIPGVIYSNVMSDDGDTCRILIESNRSIDIRKPLFNLLAEKHWPLLDVEALGVSIEDIFISVVNDSAK